MVPPTDNSPPPRARHSPNPPLVPLPTGFEDSSGLLPNDHVRMLIELLRPAGVELARRWLAALMLVDAAEREAMVAMVERQIAQLYGPKSAAPAGLQVVHPPVQRDGHIEQIVTTYEVVEPDEAVNMEHARQDQPLQDKAQPRHIRRAR